jgi:hypothetical protein
VCSLRGQRQNGAGSGSHTVKTTFLLNFSARTADERLKDKPFRVAQFWLALGRGSGDNRIHDSAFVDSLRGKQADHTE